MAVNNCHGKKESNQEEVHGFLFPKQQEAFACYQDLDMVNLLEITN